MRRRRGLLLERRTASAGAERVLSVENECEASQVCCTRSRWSSCDAPAHLHDRLASWFCMPVGLRMESMAASIALWKLTATQYAPCSCVPLLCAIRLSISSFAVDPSQRFCDLTSPLSVAPYRAAQEARAAWKFGLTNTAGRFPTTESGGNVTCLTRDTQNRGRIGACVERGVRFPYGPCMV